MDHSKTTEMFRLLLEHEEKLGELYATFADKFPESRSTWSELATDERTHAGWIRDLWRKFDNGEVKLSGEKFNPQALRSSIEYIDKVKREAASARFMLTNAVSIALDLENAMIDRKFFKVFDLSAASKDWMGEEIGEHKNRLLELLKQAEG